MTIGNTFTRRALVVLFGLTVALLLFVQIGGFGENSLADLNMAIPYMISRGMVSYKEVASYHFPLLENILAFFYRFMEPLTALRLLNMVMILSTAAMIWRASRRFSGKWGGPIGVLFFALWAVSYNQLFVIPDAIIGSCTVALFMLAVGDEPPTRGRLIWMGLVAGFAAAIKQSGIPLMLAPTIWLLLDARLPFKRRVIHTAIFLAITWVIFGIPFLVLMARGLWTEAVYWLANAGSVNVIKDWTNMINGNAYRLISITLIPLPAYFMLWLQDRPRRYQASLLWLMFPVTVLINYPVPGYYHMMAMLPLVALMTDAVAAAGLQYLEQKQFQMNVAERAVAALGAGILFASMVSALTPLSNSLRTPRITIYGWEELAPVSAWVQQNTRETDRIYIIPAYDTNGNIYAQSQRLPPVYAKIWSYFAAVPSNIEFLEKGIKANPPEVVIVFPDLHKHVAQYLTSLDSYVQQNYVEVTRIENIPAQGTAVIYRKKQP